MLTKISFNICVIIMRNLISCIDLSRDVVEFTGYRMPNMSGQLSHCRNCHQFGKPGVAF